MPATRSARPLGRWPLLTAAIAATLALAGGCGVGGGGGGGGGDPPAPLAIVTPLLPPAGLNNSYTTSLEAAGGSGGYTWALLGGNLPPGVTVQSDGTVTGMPTSLGTYSLSVKVTDTDSATATASYSLAVLPFQVTVALLHWGEAWGGESYPVSSISGASVTFALVQNQSGASLVYPNPSAGTVTYRPGPNPGIDRIRGTSGIGAVADALVNVEANPVAGMTARFSTTDVWHLRFEGKEDTTHPFASDFDATLATIGFRGATSYDAEGTNADQLARAYVQQQTLRYLNLNYLNNGDGTPAAGGLKISFPFSEPSSPPYSCPADGDVDLPAPNHFNVISMLGNGYGGGVIGTAYTDDTSNSSQENDTTSPGSGGPLGVFVDEIANYFNYGYSNDTLPGSPVSASDEAALRALFYGTASPGGRYNELRRIGEGFGRTLAATAAHEIGHSLGLQHTSPTVSGSIMNPAAVISPTAQYQFIPADLTILQGDLPGPNRGGSPLYAAGRGASDIYTGHPGDTAIICGACETFTGRGASQQSAR